MTQQEELKYLTQLVLEASRWRVSEDQADEDPLRLEITQRINTLQGVEPEVIDGRVQSVRERGLAKAAAKNKTESRSGQTKDGRMRIMYKGHRITIDKDKLVKTPNMHSRTGYVWKAAPGVNLDDYIHPRGVDDASAES